MDLLKNAVEYGIIGMLIALSIWAVAVAVERWLYYRRVDLSQFTDIQTFEMALTKRLVEVHGGRIEVIFFFKQKTAYERNLRHDGREYHYDRLKPGPEGNGCRPARRHPLRRDEQYSPAAGHRTADDL